MKKRIQRLLSFLISMVMLLAIQSVSASAHDEQYIPLGTGIAVDGSIINETKREDLTDIDYELTDLEKSALPQQYAIEQHEKFVDIYEKTPSEENPTVFEFVKDYPSGYGGSYLDGNILVIKLVKGDINLKAAIESEFDMSVISFEDSDISFYDLHLLQEKINNEFLDKDITMTMIDVKNSSVVVGIRPEVYTKGTYKAKLGPLESDEHITIEPFESMRLERDLIGGETLFNSDDDTPIGTLGMGGHYRNSPVYVTAGHVASGNNINPSLSSTSNPVLIRYGGGINGDFAFMETSGHTVSNKVYVGPSTIGTISGYSNQYNDALVGRNVFKYGFRTQLTMGEITGINGTITDIWGDIITNGLVMVRGTPGSYFSYFGDSGGPYWFLTGSSRIFTGIHTGGIDSTSDPRASFTPYYWFDAFTPKT